MNSRPAKTAEVGGDEALCCLVGTAGLLNKLSGYFRGFLEQSSPWSFWTSLSLSFSLSVTVFLLLQMIIKEIGVGQLNVK